METGAHHLADARRAIDDLRQPAERDLVDAVRQEASISPPPPAFPVTRTHRSYRCCSGPGLGNGHPGHLRRT